MRPHENRKTLIVNPKEGGDDETAHNADQINRFVSGEVNHILEPEKTAFAC